MLKAPNPGPSLIPERKPISLSKENPQPQKAVHLPTVMEVQDRRVAATVVHPGVAVRVRLELEVAAAAAVHPVLPNPESAVDG
jgi:hypothetical protein